MALTKILYLIIWICYVVELSYFLSNLRSVVPVGGWTFGQVVAIMVWAAPILEFGKLLVRKCIEFLIQTHTTNIKK